MRSSLPPPEDNNGRPSSTPARLSAARYRSKGNRQLDFKGSLEPISAAMPQGDVHWHQQAEARAMEAAESQLAVVCEPSGRLPASSQPAHKEPQLARDEGGYGAFDFQARSLLAALEAPKDGTALGPLSLPVAWEEPEEGSDVDDPVNGGSPRAASAPASAARPIEEEPLPQEVLNDSVFRERESAGTPRPSGASGSSSGSGRSNPAEVGRGNGVSIEVRPPELGDDVRTELAEYLAGVRARVDGDGNPTVTFPDNYDSVVALMGRAEIAGAEAAHEGAGESDAGPLAAPQSAGNADVANGGGSSGVDHGGKASSGSVRHDGSWVQYLLAEGLNEAPPYRRYHGVLEAGEAGDAAEQLRRGLARIQELDLRLAQQTRRAHELSAARRLNDAELRHGGGHRGGSSSSGSSRGGSDSKEGTPRSSKSSVAGSEAVSRDDGAASSKRSFQSRAFVTQKCAGAAPSRNSQAGSSGSVMARSDGALSSVRSAAGSARSWRTHRTLQSDNGTTGENTFEEVAGVPAAAAAAGAPQGESEQDGDATPRQIGGLVEGWEYGVNACDDAFAERLFEESEEEPDGAWASIASYVAAGDVSILRELDAKIEAAARLRGADSAGPPLAAGPPLPPLDAGILPGSEPLRHGRHERLLKERSAAIDRALAALAAAPLVVECSAPCAANNAASSSSASEAAACERPFAQNGGRPGLCALVSAPEALAAAVAPVPAEHLRMVLHEARTELGDAPLEPPEQIHALLDGVRAAVDALAKQRLAAAAAAAAAEAAAAAAAAEAAAAAALEAAQADQAAAALEHESDGGYAFPPACSSEEDRLAEVERSKAAEKARRQKRRRQLQRANRARRWQVPPQVQSLFTAPLLVPEPQQEGKERTGE